MAQPLECAEPKLYLHAGILGGKLGRMICGGAEPKKFID
jgi:hypothetical protein